MSTNNRTIVECAARKKKVHCDVSVNLKKNSYDEMRFKLRARKWIKNDVKKQMWLQLKLKVKKGKKTMQTQFWYRFQLHFVQKLKKWKRIQIRFGLRLRVKKISKNGIWLKLQLKRLK
jgi:hypothetical protein